MSQENLNGLEVAVIGMAGRFPGARDISEFWENIKNGLESISFFSDEEAAAADLSPAMLKNPGYVRARGILEEKEYFDSSFFGYTPNEAELMDPQIRIFHECAWQALENAGYYPGTYNGLIGLYAGASANFNWEALSLLSGRRNIMAGLEAMQATNKDFLCTKVSFKLNLQGPGVFIHTACSTSLVAIHMAYQSVLNAECDLALAGGITISNLGISGYLYQEGMINSPDGHCRAFDAKAKGTLGGEGVGVVVLKRYEDAIADKDNIEAVIIGSAVNNDGIRKVGYTTPSVKGQAEVIKTALQVAEITPESIGYVETHGTGTTLGDPVEIEALKQGFNTDKKKYCAIGSIKTNLGHLDCAAGVAGFIKTVLILKHQQIPPSLHFESPNPNIDFKNSPFYVNSKLSGWKNRNSSLRAGVSSFGIGGTNAHVILEEAFKISRDESTSTSREYKLILLSAATEMALNIAGENLAEFLKKNPGINLEDAAYTLQVGRKIFKHKKMVVARNAAEVIGALSSPASKNIRTFASEEENVPVVFVFPGQGQQYVNMGLELYQTEKVFRDEMDQCFEILTALRGNDANSFQDSARKTNLPGRRGGVCQKCRSVQSCHGIKNCLYPVEPELSRINQTELAQPALFIFEYALAKLLMNRGIKPYAMIGHSIGEYVTACLSGVFSLKDALYIVMTRGRLMQEMPAGAMLGVPLSAEKLIPLLNDEISLAAVNGPSRCVVSGSHESIETFGNQLRKKGYKSKSLHTSHAFHSQLMEPILQEFAKRVSHIELKEPKIPYISNVTGNWITVEEATSPDYWAKHLRETVLFADGIKELMKEGKKVFLEVGPGRALSAFIRQLQNEKKEHKVLETTGNFSEKSSDAAFLLNRIGQLWLYGVPIDWNKFYAGEKRRRLVLPAYPFARQRFWRDGNPFKMGIEMLSKRSQLNKKPDVADWFYVPVWKQSRFLGLEKKRTLNRNRWLIFMADCSLGSRLLEILKQQDQDVICANVGTGFKKVNDSSYILHPGQPSHYDSLLEELNSANKIPGIIVHLLNVKVNQSSIPAVESVDSAKASCFYSLLYLARALGKQDISGNIKMMIVTNNMQEVTGQETLCPEKAMVLGPCKVIPNEYPNITCCSLDIVLPGPGSEQEKDLLDRLLSDFTAESPEPLIAYRGNHRWVPHYEPVRLEETTGTGPHPRKQGVYLITGGLGGIGYVLAGHLASRVGARLILTGRTTLPPKDKWNQYLAGPRKNEGLSHKIRKILDLEKLGAEVLYFDTDVSNEEKMKEVISQSLKYFKQINGVIHCAGIPDGSLIQVRTKELSENVLAPKLCGTLVLDRILDDVKPDFFFLCSSLTSVLGHMGQAAYCSANAFLDAFAYYKTANGKFTTSINWDTWQEVGMAVEAAASKDELKDAILPSEGIDVFNRIISKSLPQVVISTRDLTRLRAMPNHPEVAKKREEPAKPESESTGSLHSRPGLSTPYIAPENEIEQKVADVWGKTFGFDSIGINDNFFELGGDSIKALHIAAVLKKENIEITAHKLLLHQTISEICSHMVTPKSDAVDVDSDSFSKTAGLQETWSKDEERKIIEQLNRNAGLSALLKKNKSAASCPVSPIQQSSLRPPYTAISKDIILFPYDFPGSPGITGIRDIILNLVNSNSLLRSIIKKTDVGYCLEQFDSFSNIEVHTIDISKYSFKVREKIINLIYLKISLPFEVIDSLLYRFVVLKLDNINYKIIFAFNHLIFDGESAGILKHKIDKICQRAAADVNKKEESTSDYIDYIHFLKNQDYSDVDLRKYLDLPEYMNYIKKVTGNFRIEGLKYDGFKIDISSLKDGFKGFYNEIMLLCFAMLIRSLFNIEKIPILFASNGRNYKDGNFSNIIGDFHDRIPVLFSFGLEQNFNPTLVIEKFIKYRKYCRDNNLNFTNYFIKTFKPGTDYSKLFSPFSFNSLIGSFEHFKDGEINEMRRKSMEQQQSRPSPLFTISIFENFQANELWVSFWQNSVLKINEIKKLFIKNYLSLIEKLNSGKGFEI